MKITLELDTATGIQSAIRLLQGLLPAPQEPVPVVGEASVLPIQEQLLVVIQGASTPVSSAELRRRFPALGAQNLAAYLAHLTRRGVVTRTAQGCYVRAAR